jgi:hypothetical protein
MCYGAKFKDLFHIIEETLRDDSKPPVKLLIEYGKHEAQALGKQLLQLSSKLGQQCQHEGKLADLLA